MFRDQKCVDFKKIDAHVHQLKGSSSRYVCVCVCDFISHQWTKEPFWPNEFKLFLLGICNLFSESLVAKFEALILPHKNHLNFEVLKRFVWIIAFQIKGFDIIIQWE